MEEKVVHWGYMMMMMIMEYINVFLCLHHNPLIAVNLTNEMNERDDELLKPLNQDWVLRALL